MNDCREYVYQLLEDKMLNFDDYVDVIVNERDDKERNFIRVTTLSRVFVVDPIGSEFTDYVPGEVKLRDEVVTRLNLAGQALKDIDPKLQLRVAYGYRPLEEQQRLFDETMSSLSSRYSGDDLIKAAHRKIALPTVAGHPTGGAVDVEILRDGVSLDMGTQLWDFGNDSFTFSPFISKEAWNNRQMLRQAMMAADFAPFDGEWWHFSYGDKEWARYYGHKEALFGQINRELLSTMLL